MSREFANQQAREGKAIMVRQVSLPYEELQQILRVFEKFEYIPVDDLFEAVQRIIGGLDKTEIGSGQQFTYGFSKASVESMLVSMLRVLSEIPSITEDPDFSKLTEEEIDKYSHNHKEAARISRKFDHENPKLEDLYAALAQTDDKDRVKTLLLSAAEDSPAVQLPNNTILPQIKPWPKTLLSDEHHAVSLSISKFEEETSTAFVKLQGAAGMHKHALNGLDGIQIRMKLDSTNENLRALFIGKQLLRKIVRCNVSVTRALRKTDDRSTFFSLVNLLDADQQGKEVADAMKAIQLTFSTSELGWMT